MAENNDVFNRADSLMRRRRAFVAAPAAPAESPATQRLGAESVMPKLEEIDFSSNQNTEDEDLPVLTEEVSAEAAVSEASPDRFDETLVAILISEIAHSIELQMKIELPMLVEASLMTAAEELRAGISTTMGIALRDFLARRQQLRLPLDEPNLRD
jgi:hypothetical protein